MSSALNKTVSNTQPVDPVAIFGPQRDELYIVLPITITYAIIFVTGILGNIFTCVVIIRNKSMHTATNYYLFSLAISDLLLLLSGMPQEIYSIWSKWPYVFGHAFCVLRGLAAETSTNASVLTITLFTVERYVAICHPFLSHKMSKLSRATKHVMWLWVAALWFALPLALQFGIRETRGVIMCLQTRVILEHSFEISTFVFFFAPMILITVLYAMIGMKLRSTNIGNQQCQRAFERSISTTHRLRSTHSKSTRRVIKMLVAVVVAFFLCWAPFHAQRLVAIYGTTENHVARSPIMLTAYYFLTYTSGVFYYMSTCINPILYHIMSNKFRDCFKNSFQRWCCKSRRPAAKQCSYTAMAFVKNPSSSGTGNNSGNSGSQRNEPAIVQIRSRRQDKEKVSGHSHVCRTVEVISRPEGEDNINYNSHFLKTHHSEVPRDEAKRPYIGRCQSVCCLHQPYPRDPLTVISEPILSAPEQLTNDNSPRKYFEEIKLRMSEKEYG